MPVIRPTSRGESLASLRESLVTSLADELRGTPNLRGPIVFEMSSGKSDRINVMVVWDAWGGFSPAERASIVHAAYERFSRKSDESPPPTGADETSGGQIGPRLMTVIGATRGEALSQGLLPYEIQPMLRRDDSVDRTAIRRLMLEAGGIESGGSIRLRLPSAQLAADTHARLSEEMPEGHWSVVEEVGLYQD